MTVEKTSYLKGRLVVPHSILQDENVAEQLVAIGFLDFDGWCDIDDRGAFLHQTMIAISVSDEGDAWLALKSAEFFNTCNGWRQVIL